MTAKTSHAAAGNTALYAALAALDLPKGSEVICSPVTDPGILSAIILNGPVPRLAGEPACPFFGEGGSRYYWKSYLRLPEIHVGAKNDIQATSAELDIVDGMLVYPGSDLGLIPKK